MHTIGGAGNDNLRDGKGNDYLSGGDGNDELSTFNDGNNTVYAGSGNDSMFGGDGNDFLDAGSGNDYVNYAGSLGNNTLFGGAGDDYMTAGKGNDSLDGGAGDDELYAEEGNCTLHGGIGNDELRAGSGVDRFTYAYGDGQDTIRGYDGNQDIIDLSGVDYTLSRKVDNDVLISLGTGSILLQYPDGDAVKINDRYGRLHSINTTNLPYTSSTYSAKSANLVEDTEASYVNPNTWSMDSSMDAINTARMAAMDAEMISAPQDTSLVGSAALTYGNENEQNHLV